jgi:hypothetical protein
MNKRVRVDFKDINSIKKYGEENLNECYDIMYEIALFRDNPINYSFDIVDFATYLEQSSNKEYIKSIYRRVGTPDEIMDCIITLIMYDEYMNYLDENRNMVNEYINCSDEKKKMLEVMLEQKRTIQREILFNRYCSCIRTLNEIISKGENEMMHYNKEKKQYKVDNALAFERRIELLRDVADEYSSHYTFFYLADGNNINKKDVDVNYLTKMIEQREEKAKEYLISKIGPHQGIIKMLTENACYSIQEDEKLIEINKSTFKKIYDKVGMTEETKKIHTTIIEQLKQCTETRKLFAKIFTLLDNGEFVTKVNNSKKLELSA